MAIFEVLPELSKAAETELAPYNKWLKQLLFNRNITSHEEAEGYLHPSYEAQLHDPFLLNDMDKAVRRILDAMSSNQKVVIYSDYDCDGIPGAVVLHDFFVAAGFTNQPHSTSSL